MDGGGLILGCAKGPAKLKIEWDTRDLKHSILQTIIIYFKRRLINKNIGSVDTLNLKPENTIEAFYETPIVTHAMTMNYALVQGMKQKYGRQHKFEFNNREWRNDCQQTLALSRKTLHCTLLLLVAALEEG